LIKSMSSLTTGFQKSLCGPVPAVVSNPWTISRFAKLQAREPKSRLLVGVK
jgi:hypothetical protein